MISIDRNQLYQVDKYLFKNFVILTDKEKQLVWTWRNDERIRQWMYDKTEKSYENHLKFIEGLEQRNSAYYWLVYKDDTPLGVFDIVDIDIEKEAAEPGYYLNPDFLNSGEGLFFNYYFRSFIYNILELKYVKGHIICGNSRAYTMSSFFGVKAVSLVEISGIKYLVMKGAKQDFNKISRSTLLRDFVKYSKALSLNWDNLINGLSNA
jgi:UDP-4-amino-4,6-dideoxy-N-acetyl-beta-L-altrosamine N-acetyltransferase